MHKGTQENRPAGAGEEEEKLGDAVPPTHQAEHVEAAEAVDEHPAAEECILREGGKARRIIDKKYILKSKQQKKLLKRLPNKKSIYSILFPSSFFYCK